MQPETSLASTSAPKRLILGIGNTFRRDDGLGIRLAERVCLPGFDVVTVTGVYPELAETLQACAVVVFVDAAIEGVPVDLARIHPDASSLPVCHGITCQGILALTDALYHTYPEAYLLSLRGYDFTYGEGLSDQALANLDQGLRCLKELYTLIEAKRLTA